MDHVSLSLVLLNMFVSNLQFKFIIDGQTFLLIAGLYTYIYIYYIYTFKRHSLPENNVVTEFCCFYCTKQKHSNLQAEYFPFIFGASFQ